MNIGELFYVVLWLFMVGVTLYNIAFILFYVIPIELEREMRDRERRIRVYDENEYRW